MPTSCSLPGKCTKASFCRPDYPSGERRHIRDGHAWSWCAAEIALRRLCALQAAGTGVYAGRGRAVRWRVLHGAALGRGAEGRLYGIVGEIEDESQDSLRVDINTADVEELDELPEVGPSTAQSIVEYRETNGQFSSVDELAWIHNCIRPVELTFSALLTEGGAKVLFHHGLEHQRGGELRSRMLPTVSAL